MTRDQLEHAIRAACEVAGDDELYVFGSQAILAQFPDAPEVIRGSMEVDVQPKNRPEMTDAIDGSLGELSRFHSTYGYYVHGVSIDSAVLPVGWESRTVSIMNVATNEKAGLCLEAHDLAASKLAADREKDREFVTVLLAECSLDPDILVERVSTMPSSSDERDRLIRWIRRTAAELESSNGQD